MLETILAVCLGFIALVVIVKMSISAAMQANLKIQEKIRQDDVIKDLSIRQASLTMALDTTLKDFRTDMREMRGQMASQLTLESVAKYLTEIRQELTPLHEITLLAKVNTGRIGAIERMVLSINHMMMTDGPSLPPSPNIPGFTVHSGPGSWRPLGIKRDGSKYKTEDGEHEADSIEELLHKLSTDPKYRIDPNLKINQEEIDKMEELFEEHLNEDEREGWQEDKDKDDDTWDETP